MDDRRILLKKNPFTNSSQKKNTLQGVDVTVKVYSQEKNTLQGVDVTVKVYSQEKTSREQMRRVHNKVQTRPH